MRIIRFIAPDGRILHGEVEQDGFATVLSGSLAEGFTRTAERSPITKLLAPIVPTDIICIGRNYRSPKSNHAGSDQREDPDRTAAHDDSTLEVFLKPSTALQNPNDPILIPHFDGLDPQLDCEGELAVLIGREARNVSEANALKHIFGYTIANDVTARAFQTPTGPPIWMRGKGFDTFCPLGPAIVTADEIPDAQSLSLRTLISGKVVREGNTRDMIRTVPQIIAALSRHMSLRAGAIILTGAPQSIAGAGGLSNGNRVEIQVDRCGSLNSICKAH